MSKTMTPTPIDWADYVWNVFWGCLFRCVYCYARNTVVPRFAKARARLLALWQMEELHKNNAPHFPSYSSMVCEIESRLRRFEPTEFPWMWDYKVPVGAAVFLNSMFDINICTPDQLDKFAQRFENEKPGTSFITLTKDFSFTDKRFFNGINTYLGYTVTNNADVERLAARFQPFWPNQFVNVEPLLEPLTPDSIAFLATAPAVIIGAETGNRDGIAKLGTSAEWCHDVAMEINRDSQAKVFVKNPAYSYLLNLWFSDCIDESYYMRQLLWTTRKAVV